MDKKTFYDELVMRLKNLGVRSDYIEKHMAQFEKYFEGKTNEQIEEEIASLGDLDRVASRIKRATDKMLLAESGIPFDDDDSKAETAQIPSIDENKPASEKTDSAETCRPIVKLDKTEKVKEKKPKKKEEDTPSKHLTVSHVDDETLKKRLLVFRIIFFLSLPLVLCILLLTAAVFAIIYFAIAVIIIGAVVALGAVAVAGAGISFFGIVLGIVKMFSLVPAGLYEIGLSVMIGAAAMFVGILIYNFAVRLMPWLAGLLLKFAKFVFKKYRLLYVFIKKECVRL